MKINTTIGYDCTPMRMAKIKKKKSTTTKWWQRFRVSIADGMQSCRANVENSFAVSYKVTTHLPYDQQSHS